jgi:uncharacterized protein with PhoU and TrkA domain
MSDFEKIEYKPRSVREILIEMKDISELMIDLAYSAALFNDRELAEEVLELESRVDTLAYQLNMSTMIATRDPEDAQGLVGVLKVASSADKISDAAADIATIVLRDIGVHPLVSEVFKKVEEGLVKARVNANSILAGKRLDELELASKIGVDIIAIRRRKEWIIDPKGKETIEKGDILIARGSHSGVEELKKLAEGTLQKLEEE